MKTINQQKPPTILIIFGATGDLANKKLLPALYNLDKSSHFPEKFKIIASARRELSTNQYLESIKKSIKKEHEEQYTDETWNNFAKKINYIYGDFNAKKTYIDLATKLNKIDEDFGVCTHKIFYLAISPDIYEIVFNGLETTRLKQICKNIKDTRLVVEKPFGRNKSSFLKLNNLIKTVFAEDQIYRIDHYLAKETVQNLLYFKSANPLFMSKSAQDGISKIEINVTETVGVEKRASYYENYGQLRDMLQSHILQILALSLIDVPYDLDLKKIRKQKSEILSSLRIENMKNDLLRGQYESGLIKGSPVVSYLEEEGVNNNSQIETFVRINAKLTFGEWKNLPITINTGKRLQQKLTEIRVIYNKNIGPLGKTSENILTFRLQPEEEISLSTQVKKIGKSELQVVPLKFSYESVFGKKIHDAYEAILKEIIDIKQSFFLGSEELVKSWEFVDKITDYWEKENPTLVKYPAGIDWKLIR